MIQATPDLGETYPAGHPSGRIWKPPASAEQARARLIHHQGRMDAACRAGAEAGDAIACLDEALEDFCALVTGGAR